MKEAKLKILLIDDETGVFETVSAYAEKENMIVEHAKNGELGMEFFRKGKFDAIIVDWMLPGITGPEIVKTIREKSDVPILMISARDDEADIVIGLELGADDYITKPFGPRELMARIKNCIRRNTPTSKNIKNIRIGNLELCFEKREFFKNKKKFNLTPNELRILQALLENADIVVTRENLMEKTLGRYDYLSDRTLDTHIKNLRHKLEDNPQNPKIIETVREIGFKLNTK